MPLTGIVLREHCRAFRVSEQRGWSFSSAGLPTESKRARAWPRNQNRQMPAPTPRQHVQRMLLLLMVRRLFPNIPHFGNSNPDETLVRGEAPRPPRASPLLTRFRYARVPRTRTVSVSPDPTRPVKGKTTENQLTVGTYSEGNLLVV